MAFPPANYVACFPLQAYFVDRDTGMPLSAGYIRFFEDEARTLPKDVFIQQQQPNNDYIFVNIGSTVTLSSVGTTQYLGTDSIIFLYPFDADGNEELYYIEVFSSMGVNQFTREAWPPNTIASSSSSASFLSSENIIANPQFAVVNFLPYPASSIVITIASSGTTEIAPDWSIIAPSAGTVTLSQVSVTDTSAPGLPAFALDIAVSGFSGAVILAQTIENSPRLLENGFASGSFIVEAIGAPSSVAMNFVPSNPSLAPLVVASGTASLGGYTLINGTIPTPSGANINPDGGATGYIQIQLVIQNSTNVRLSCVQLLSVAMETEVPEYIQESTPRQIDHLYHYAYPIVPIGAIIDFAGYNSPEHYLRCDGSSYLRSTYNQLFNVITNSETVSLTMGLNTFTVADGSIYYIGMTIEGMAIVDATTITGITGNVITMSNNASATQSSVITFFAWGRADTTHFNVPNLSDNVTAGDGGSLFGAGNTALGAQGGASTHAISIAEMPAHTHPGSSVAIGQSGTGSSGSGISGTTNGPTSVSVVSQGGGTAMSLVQLTTITKKYIRFE